MSTTTSPAPTTTAPRARRISAAGAIGSAIEWYDYSLYGAASALILPHLFFPSLSPAAGQAASFATFAVGFAARPLGGIVFGNIGDRIGRKTTLLVTVVLMGAVTALMGVLPSYGTIGLAAPILLIVLRLIQGLGAGAEFAGALTYVAEGVEPRRRSFWTAVTGSASISGGFIATGLFAILSATLSPAAFLSFGWRIAFLFSLVLVIPALIIRAGIQESPQFVALRKAQDKGRVKRARIPLFDMLRNDPRSFVSALLAPTILSVIGYVITVFGISYMVNTLKLTSSASLVVDLVTVGSGIVAAPFFGLLADVIGARRVMIGAAIFGIVAAFPYFQLFHTGNFAIIAIASALMYAITWGGSAGAQGTFLPSLFKTRYRFTGVATGRELNTAIFSGPAPLIAGALTTATHGAVWPVAIMIVVTGVISIIGLAIGKPNKFDDGQDDSLVTTSTEIPVVAP